MREIMQNEELVALFKDNFPFWDDLSITEKETFHPVRFPVRFSEAFPLVSERILQPKTPLSVFSRALSPCRAIQ